MRKIHEKVNKDDKVPSAWCNHVHLSSHKTKSVKQVWHKDYERANQCATHNQKKFNLSPHVQFKLSPSRASALPKKTEKGEGVIESGNPKGDFEELAVAFLGKVNCLWAGPQGIIFIFRVHNNCTKSIIQSTAEKEANS